MTMNSNSLKFTSEVQVAVPKQTAPSFVINENDWKKIRKLINDFSEDVRWIELLLSITVSSFVSFLISYFSTNENSSGKDMLVKLMIGTGTAAICLAIFYFIRRNDNKATKKRIIEEMDALCYIDPNLPLASVSEEEKTPIVIDKWQATKTQCLQGASFLKIDLDGKLITTLVFKVSSPSDYWRSGIKLAAPYSNPDSQILTNKSFVIHLSKSPANTNSIGVDIYLNGDTSNAVHKLLPELYSQKELTFTLERTESNSMNCYINDRLVYSGKIKKEFLKNIYLCAWGDEYDYDVLFKGIKYTTGNF